MENICHSLCSAGFPLRGNERRHARHATLCPSCKPGSTAMPLLNDIRNTPLLWLLVLVPVVLVAEALKPEAHTLLFVLSVLAIVPLAALLSRATEAVASRTGDMIGGLLNATLGNLTELLIALAALRAGQY